MPSFLDLLAPPACVVCRAVPAGGPLCAACRARLPWLGDPRCRRCGLPAPCATPCPARGQSFAAAWAPMAYEGPVRRLVHALKVRHALGLCELLAAQMAATAPGWLTEGTALVPVPADPLRRRRRGHDHTLRLAEALAARTGLALAPCLRRAPGRRQTGAARRLRTAPDRLRVAPMAPPPATALLVDDVHTTGATLDACAGALLAGGSTEVRALTYARALREIER